LVVTNTTPIRPDLAVANRSCANWFWFVRKKGATKRKAVRRLDWTVGSATARDPNPVVLVGLAYNHILC
jgi:hypothetical protein